jgi:choline dehydrogenase
MSEFDYIVVGAGSAGCVLAARLSEDPGARVLLIEAGPKDSTPLIRVPMGFGKLLGNEKYAWHLLTQPFGAKGTVEGWPRGKTLGGSSAINGLVYNRGQRADWDELERLGNEGWNWEAIVAAYRAIENNQLGPSPTRGTGGPVTISRATPDPLSEAAMEAASAVGMARVEDFNESDDPRIGATMANIANGRRVSSAHAFLHPAERRPNLTVAVDTLVTQVLFEGDRAVGVRTRQGGSVAEVRATRDVILSLGSINTPKLLELSGIGSAEILRAAGVDPRVDQPNVGARLHEHRCFRLQLRLRENLGYNKQLSSSLGQGMAALKYLVTHKGPLAGPSFDAIGFLKTDPAAPRVDGQILISPVTVASKDTAANPTVEREPGIQALGYILRPTSEGHSHITSADPTAPLEMVPNYFDTDYDRRTGLAIFAKMRELFSQDPIARHISHETMPGGGIVDGEELIEKTLQDGFCGNHTVGTCAMGPDETDVVDPKLRVRGVEGLRVMDCSVLPTMVAGNLNAPMMAMAWHAADVIREGRP